ncbi:MAG: hypothetical protein IIZ56_02800 [Clostridia bacterium]|nr:hypothetical protein [Clostridia bacterium]MBR4658802.1 hypothetical protein [Clostridia bacterium]
MVKMLVVRIAAAAVIAASAEAMLPTGKTAESAKRAVAVIETVLCAEAVLELIRCIL